MDKLRRESMVVALNTDQVLYLYDSENETMNENCDSVIGYELYDNTGGEIDGGEMDYNAKEKGYKTIEDALEDVLDFIFDVKLGGITAIDTGINDIDDYFGE